MFRRLAPLLGFFVAASHTACDSTPLDNLPSDGGAGTAASAGSTGNAGQAGSGTSGEAGSPDAGGVGGSATGGSSTSGTGGSGGGDTSGSGGEAGANPCDDSNPATTDFAKPLYGCGHLYDSDPTDSLSWIVFDSGFSVDLKSGYGWLDLSKTSGSATLGEAQGACEQFSIAGLGDWRVPTIDEARTLAAGCTPTLSGGTCPIQDPGCLSQVCGYGAAAECESCKGLAGPGLGGAYCNPDATVCSFFHTSSLCSDCSGSQDWEYGPGNGNFAPGNVTDQIAAVCVMPGVPDATP